MLVRPMLINDVGDLYNTKYEMLSTAVVLKTDLSDHEGPKFFLLLKSKKGHLQEEDKCEI
ncbi:hypothetical protein M514_12664 [Trichuris suis]|uniref:Uncharacterized protein n=1 Tax=Trichuris suis TaxID=68888 RepID=A0A085MTR3_9BILA|nr:hypothetical protein M513_12664 [Trichuris suis]KFD60609.1 hypothetical protein M514_12664 [Trichuris suis]